MLADRGVLQLDVVSDAGECESRRDVARKLMSRLQVTGGADQSMLTVMLAVWERRSVGPSVRRSAGREGQGFGKLPRQSPSNNWLYGWTEPEGFTVHGTSHYKRQSVV